MYYFATLFDKNYLTRGLVLYDSMQEHIEDFTLYVIALDNEVVEYIEKKNDNTLQVIQLSDIEKKYPELIKAKNSRSIVEYYFTLSPIIPLYMLETFPEIDFITTLDADILFFSSPKPIFDEFKNYSILITMHDFAEDINYKIKYGKYNVSFQSFRRNKEGFDCLQKWKSQCLDWCYDELEDDKFADQKYLNNWTAEYKNVLEIVGKGAGIAPWNISKYRISNYKGDIFCNNDKLIFYHFHGMRFISGNTVIHHLEDYNVYINKSIKNNLYKKYIFSLNKYNKINNIRNENITRYNKVYTNKSLLKLFINNRSFYKLFNIGLINIQSIPFYKIIKRIYFRWKI